MSYLCLASLSAFVTAYSHSDFFGKLIILGLVFISLLCWVVLIHKIWLLRKMRALSYAFQTAFNNQRKNILGIEVENLSPHPFASVYQQLKAKTIEILNKNHYFAEEKSQVYLSEADLAFIESQMATAISVQSKALEKNIYLLSTIVTLAPFVGLLGTVWGILIFFSNAQGGSLSSNSAVLGGLSTALATTVLGLVIAIPALISYNYLKNALKDFSSDMEDFASDLLAQIELQYRRVK